LCGTEIFFSFSFFFSRFVLAKPPPPPVEEEETLAQRRKRIQEEQRTQAAGSADAPPKFRTNMANILQAYPISAPQRPPGEDVMRPNRATTTYPLIPNMIHPPGHPLGAGMTAPPYGMPPCGSGAVYGNAAISTGHAMGQQGFNYGMPYLADATGTIDPKQRDMIDRWRQSIVRH
jgi:hypothetical protein